MRLGNQKGMTLVEVLIALVILGVIASGLATALSVSHKTTFGINQRTTAESLTRTELEYIKYIAYDDSLDPGHPQYDVDPNINIPAGYSIEVAAERLDPKGDGIDNDDGIQQVTVEVYFEGELLLTTESYKVNR